MDVNDFLQQLQRQSSYADQIVHVRELPARPAKYGTLSRPLPLPLENILKANGIENLYCHQTSAIEKLRDIKNVLVVTGTASGKTLCYNLPIVEQILESPTDRAMYLFPTKALAQDQLATLKKWRAAEPEIKKNLRVATYDGDTPSGSRGKIRNSANIILTNPDMLHQSILPYHAKWTNFFRNLRYVVIDELHTYRGIFGSQFANVLRRLVRLLEFHGGNCQFICASATIGNPRELAEWLTQHEVELVDEDGSPRGKKTFVFWNPPFTDAGRMVRKSANVEAKTLFTELLTYGSQSIVFTRARVVAELIYRYARDLLIETDQADLAQQIRAYRGGYLSEDRREIESLLFSGKLKGVCATNALELGIDVGSLDAAILVGYPGSISSAWQQAGRSGRRASESLAMLIAYNDPIDQYIMHNPDYFFNRKAESAVINADNPHILAGHLQCAAFELPLVKEDEKYFGQAYAKILKVISEENPNLHKIADHTHWASSEFPAGKVNLRTISQEIFSIIDVTEGQSRTIGTLDRSAALDQLYPSAIYLHEGVTYIVIDLDIDQNLARVERSEADYYTRPIITSTSRVFESSETRRIANGDLGFSPLEITWKTEGYKRIKFYSQQTIAIEPLHLPEQSLRTCGLWFSASEGILELIGEAGYLPLNALAGLQNLLAWALPILAMCDPGDIATQIDMSSFSRPAILLYDRYLEGLGFARRGYENFSELLKLANKIACDCGCDDGCPSCVGVQQTSLKQDGSESPNKQATLLLLENLL